MTSPVMTPGSTLPVADLVLRPATLDDAAFAADLFTAVRPDEPLDPVLTRFNWQSGWESRQVTERFVAHLRGRPVGFAARRHMPWERMPERYGKVAAELLPGVRTSPRLDALFAFVEERSRDDGTRTFEGWAWEDDALRSAVLRDRGYREERRQRYWELDLVTNRERLAAMAEASRAKMRAQGIEITTLDRVADPDRYRKLWRMSEEAEQDVPTTVPHVATPFEEWAAWFRSPGTRADRMWIARLGDDVVGVSALEYPPARGVVQTDWTATARSVRGRGVARALKCETVMQAMALGVGRVRTDNDHENAPILHLNESMGYRRRPDMIQFLKPA